MKSVVNRARSLNSNHATEKSGNQTAQLVDNRPETAQMMRLQGMADNNPKTTQLFTSPTAANSPFQLKGYAGTRPLGQKDDGKEKSTDWNFGIGNLRLVHEHIKFDNNQDLPTVGNQDNIGFHDNSLFSENVGSMGYTWRYTFEDEDKLVAAVNSNNSPGKYNVITNNCQDWVSSVKASYNAT